MYPLVSRWPWLYDSWIYNCLCNQCLSPLTWVRIPIKARCIFIVHYVLKSVTCNKSVVFSTNKTDRHDITEILLKVVLNTIKPTNQPYVSMTATLQVFSSISFNINIQLIDQIHINLFFVVSGLSPKSNRS